MGISTGYVVNNTVTLLQLYLPNSKTNILIDNNGRAQLAEFGLSTIAPDQLTDESSSRLGGRLRWMSPELLTPENFGLKDSHRTKESDCYALGMVIYEVLSGNLPFAPYKEYATVEKILGGERPKRPRGVRGIPFTDNIWGMLELCWKPQPRDRISASAVLLRLEEHLPLLMPSPNVDGDAETDSDEQQESSSDEESESGSDDESESGSDDELESGSDDESESGSDDEWHSAESDCMISPFRPGLIFDSRYAVQDRQSHMTTTASRMYRRPRSGMCS
jgi:hypothetical protein